MKRNAVVTGAGSGVGRAVAIALAQQDWNIALVGRREDALRETARLASAAHSVECTIVPCDIGDVQAVQRMAAAVIEQLGPVELLVNAAGTNVPKRSLQVLSLDDYHQMLSANLHGAFYCVQAFIGSMRQRNHGTIVNIGSEAGVQASPKSGPGYVISKFGLRGFTQSINAEERANGIRACSILPGDIDTPLLDKRPAPPTADARKQMLQPEDIAACVLLAVNLPPRAVIEELLIRPK